MNKFKKYFNEYYSNASFVRWYTENLAMIREQYQREVVESFLFVDIPGTYSLMSNSEEEEIARDYICFNNPDVTLIDFPYLSRTGCNIFVANFSRFSISLCPGVLSRPLDFAVPE